MGKIATIPAEKDLYSKITLYVMLIIMTLFLLVSGTSENSVSKMAAVIMLILVMAALITGKFNELPKDSITPIVISTAAYLVIYFVSLFYATTGQFALTVFSYYLGGVSVFFLTILMVNKNPLYAKFLLFILAFSIAVAGIFSIDAASMRVFTTILESILSFLLQDEIILLGSFEAGTRITSIIGNPNVFGSLSALGTLASSYLFLSGNSKRERNISSGLLIINAVSFLYCFSLGAIIGMFLAIICFIIFAGKEERSRITYVVLATMITSFLSVFTGFTGMGNNNITVCLPLFTLIIFGFILAFIFRFIDSFTMKMNALGRKRLLLILLIFIITLSVALTLSDSYTFNSTSDTLRRSVTLKPGSYQLEMTAAKELSGIDILVESQSYKQASTHTASTLYHGKMNSRISFIVPYDAEICFINITAPEGTVVEKVSILNQYGQTIKSIKPNYLLLPTFMTNRLQGILVNENAAQRFVFFQDGLKIAAKSPVMGHGPGAFESKILEVQEYYYVTSSAHNHYIQTLDEVGIIGLLSFLCILVFSVIALLKRFHTDQNRILYASLSAMFTLIVVHAFIEGDFQYGIYNMAAFMVFALISCCFGQKEESVPKKKITPACIPRTAVQGAFLLCLMVLTIYLGQFASMNHIKQAELEKSRSGFLGALTVGAILDFTNAISYKTSYLVTYTPDLPESYYLKSQQYANNLEKSDSYGALFNLANYYLKVGQNEKAYGTLNHMQSLMRYDASAWNNTFNFYREAIDNIRTTTGESEDLRLIKEYAMQAYNQFQSYLAVSPLDIKLSDENSDFLKSL